MTKNFKLILEQNLKKSPKMISRAQRAPRLLVYHKYLFLYYISKIGHNKTVTMTMTIKSDKEYDSKAIFNFLIIFLNLYIRIFKRNISAIDHF